MIAHSILRANPGHCRLLVVKLVVGLKLYANDFLLFASNKIVIYKLSSSF